MYPFCQFGVRKVLSRTDVVLSVIQQYCGAVTAGAKHPCLHRRNEFVGNVIGFVALGLFSEEVREEKQFKDNEDDEQLDENDGPQRAAERHFPEAVVVESPYVVKPFHHCFL